MNTDPYSILRKHHLDKYGWSGSCIKAYRINKGMSRDMLASQLKMRSSTLNMYEEGLRPVGIKLAKKLAEVFKVDWHVFRKQPKSVIVLTKEEFEDNESKTKKLQEESVSISKVKRKPNSTNRKTKI